MRTLILILASLAAVPAWALDGAAPDVTQAASTATPATQPGKDPGVQLGKVEVKGTKPLVEVLQQMKLAIVAPFSDDPGHYDDMVCRIVDDNGYRAQGALLDCGSQGYYGMHRNQQRQAMDPLDNVADKPVATLGHPWHVTRLLNYEQLGALRTLLGKLPLPGKGQVQVIDDTAPAPAKN